MRPNSFNRHRFPADVIRQAVWLYFHFTMSLRDAEDLLTERGIFGSIVQPAAHLAAIGNPQLAHRCGVESQNVGDNRLGLAKALQRILHECQSCGFIPFLGDEGLEDFALMIDSTPEGAVSPTATRLRLAQFPLTSLSSGHKGPPIG